MRNELTLADLLSDLRYVADVTGTDYRRASELDTGSVDCLIRLGWIELVWLSLRVTLDGLDVLHACRGVVLASEAA